MSQHFSKGMGGEVRHLTPDESRLFPLADLVKNEHPHTRTNDAFWPARLFYMHRVAHLVFPNTFIQVTDCTLSKQMITEETLPWGETARIHHAKEFSLYSKRAEVHPDHAPYSADMTLDNEMQKVSVCSCRACSAHRQFHEDNQMEERARQKASQLSEAGIFVPTDDPSDYCLSADDVLFFEIDRLRTDVLQDYLLWHPIEKSIDTHVQRCLYRIEQLRSMSRETCLLNAGVSFHL